jgi:rhamnose utilization protein RhaD (predicted bifunctional aldolase and dehydrogenase)
MTRTPEALKKEAAKFLKEAHQLEIENELEKMQTAATALHDSIAEDEHLRKTKAWREWAEAKAYIEGLAVDLAAEGTYAEHPVTGAKTVIGWKSADTIVSYGTLTPGTVVHIDSTPYLIKSSETDHVSQTATILPLTAKFYTDKQNPFNHIPCAWSSVRKELTVSPNHKLAPGQIIAINGKSYQPTAAYLGAYVCMYDLQEVTA